MGKLEYINRKYKPNLDEDLICEYKIIFNDFMSAGMSLDSIADKIASESSMGDLSSVGYLNIKFESSLKPHVFKINKVSNIVKIAYSKDLFENNSITQILNSLHANLFVLKHIAKIDIIDIHIPTKMLNDFLGPRYGIEGIRKLTKIKKRPLFNTKVIPKIGLPSSTYANIAYNSWSGGADIINDDISLSNQVFSSFEERVIRCLDMADRAQSETGERKIYVPNISAEIAEMIKRADFVKDHGGQSVMVDSLVSGFSSLESVRKHTKQFIYSTIPDYSGISNLALSKVCRLTGIDMLDIKSNFRYKTLNPDPSDTSISSLDIIHELEDKFVKKNKHILEEKWGTIKSTLPICSGSINPCILPDVMNFVGKNIVIQDSGTSLSHPDGIKSGATAMRQAIDALTKNKSIYDYSKSNVELDKAIKKWA